MLGQKNIHTSSLRFGQSYFLPPHTLELENTPALILLMVSIFFMICLYFCLMKYIKLRRISDETRRRLMDINKTLNDRVLEQEIIMQAIKNSNVARGDVNVCSILAQRKVLSKRRPNKRPKQFLHLLPYYLPLTSAERHCQDGVSMLMVTDMDFEYHMAKKVHFSSSEENVVTEFKLMKLDHEFGRSLTSFNSMAGDQLSKRPKLPYHCADNTSSQKYSAELLDKYQLKLNNCSSNEEREYMAKKLKLAHLNAEIHKINKRNAKAREIKRLKDLCLFRQPSKWTIKKKEVQQLIEKIQPVGMVKKIELSQNKKSLKNDCEINEVPLVKHCGKKVEVEEETGKVEQNKHKRLSLKIREMIKLNRTRITPSRKKESKSESREINLNETVLKLQSRPLSPNMPNIMEINASNTEVNQSNITKSKSNEQVSSNSLNSIVIQRVDNTVPFPRSNRNTSVHGKKKCSQTKHMSSNVLTTVDVRPSTKQPFLTKKVAEGKQRPKTSGDMAIKAQKSRPNIPKTIPLSDKCTVYSFSSAKYHELLNDTHENSVVALMAANGKTEVIGKTADKDATKKYFEFQAKDFSLAKLAMKNRALSPVERKDGRESDNLSKSSILKIAAATSSNESLKLIKVNAKKACVEDQKRKQKKGIDKSKRLSTNLESSKLNTTCTEVHIAKVEDQPSAEARKVELISKRGEKPTSTILFSSFSKNLKVGKPNMKNSFAHIVEGEGDCSSKMSEKTNIVVTTSSKKSSLCKKNKSIVLGEPKKEDVKVKHTINTPTSRLSSTPTLKEHKDYPKLTSFNTIVTNTETKTHVKQSLAKKQLVENTTISNRTVNSSEIKRIDKVKNKCSEKSVKIAPSLPKFGKLAIPNMANLPGSIKEVARKHEIDPKVTLTNAVPWKKSMVDTKVTNLTVKNGPVTFEEHTKENNTDSKIEEKYKNNYYFPQDSNMSILVSGIRDFNLIEDKGAKNLKTGLTEKLTNVLPSGDSEIVKPSMENKLGLIEVKGDGELHSKFEMTYLDDKVTSVQQTKNYNLPNFTLDNLSVALNEATREIFNCQLVDQSHSKASTIGKCNETSHISLEESQEEVGFKYTVSSKPKSGTIVSNDSKESVLINENSENSDNVIKAKTNDDYISELTGESMKGKLTSKLSEEAVKNVSTVPSSKESSALILTIEDALLIHENKGNIQHSGKLSSKYVATTQSLQNPKSPNVGTRHTKSICEREPDAVLGGRPSAKSGCKLSLLCTPREDKEIGPSESSNDNSSIIKCTQSTSSQPRQSNLNLPGIKITRTQSINDTSSGNLKSDKTTSKDNEMRLKSKNDFVKGTLTQTNLIQTDSAGQNMKATQINAHKTKEKKVVVEAECLVNTEKDLIANNEIFRSNIESENSKTMLCDGISSETSIITGLPKQKTGKDEKYDSSVYNFGNKIDGKNDLGLHKSDQVSITENEQLDVPAGAQIKCQEAISKTDENMASFESFAEGVYKAVDIDHPVMTADANDLKTTQSDMGITLPNVMNVAAIDAPEIFKSQNTMNGGGADKGEGIQSD